MDAGVDAPAGAPEWHRLSASEALDLLGTDPRAGLSESAASERLAVEGPNELPPPPRRGRVLMFVDQFNDVMVWLLIAAAIFSALGRDWVDAVVIGAILLLNAALGFLQETKAEAAVDSLRDMSAPQATVMRDGTKRVVAARDIVVGDLVVLAAGDVVPADLRLVEAVDLEVDESSLTGESLAVAKHPAAIRAEGVGLGDRVNMARLGSTVQLGRGTGVVVATGASTELGVIAKAASVAEDPTPLQVELKRMGRLIVVFVVGASLAVFLSGMLAGRPLDQMLLAAIALAVSAVPEALTAVVTITLGVGVRRMAKENAIVRRLHSVETLGATDVIATDKTGTLTVNRMSVGELWSAGRTVTAAELHEGPESWVCRLLEAGALANDAEVGGESAVGDPTETALVAAALAAGIDKAELDRRMDRVGEVGFTSDRKMMTTLHSGQGGLEAFTKGAPERVIAASRMTEAERERAQEAVTEMAGRGMRTLAMARRRFDHPPAYLEAEESDMEFLGVVGLTDPPRPEARRSVETAQRAGLRVVMVTGDHAVTAAAIAAQVGLPEDEGVLTGADVDAMTDAELAEALESTAVVARVDPLHKLRIVDALKADGHVVAVTGDGVNDAPALRAADVGVAMGVTGTEVAKEASDMVLADDDFGTIVAAIHEGRIVYANLTKFIHFLLSANVSQVLLMFGVTVVGLPVPLLPVQLLWTNMVTDSLPALALGVDPPEQGMMSRSPRRAGESIIARGAIGSMVLRGAILTLGTAATFLGVLMAGGVPLMAANDPRYATVVAAAQTATLTALVLQKLLFSLTFRSRDHSILSRESLRNGRLLAAIGGAALLQLAVVYIPGAGTFLHTVPLGPAEWAIMIPAIVVPVLLIDAIKLAGRARRAPAAPARTA
jgi:Ca2+-transporting ATPase